MKKVFTLLFSIAIISASFAQSNHHDHKMKDSRDIVLGNQDRRIDYNDDRDHEKFTKKKRETENKKVRNEFEKKINDVRRDRHLSYREKNRRIDQLERERNEELRRIESCFNERNMAYGKRYDGNRNRYGNNRY